MAQAGGIGVIHHNLDIAEQADEVRKVKKFESGMVVNPVTIHPDADAGRRADADGRAPHLRHPGGRAQHAASWSASSPTATCASPPTRSSRSRELMTKDKLVTVRESVEPRGGQAPAAPAPHREAARGRRRLSLHRPDHGEGHREGAALSPTPARTSRAACASAPPPAPARTASRAPRRCSTPASTCSWSIPRTAIPQRVLEAVTRIRRLSNYTPGHRRQYRDRRGRQGADRRRRRCGQGRHRPGLDLHHAHRRGRRRAAAHRDDRRGRGVPQAATCR